MTLAEIKEDIRLNAAELETAGMCTKENQYQELLNSVAQDIRNQRIYRRQRKQELSKLNNTLKELEGKKQFYAEQTEYFNNYVDACMQQLTKKPVKFVLL